MIFSLDIELVVLYIITIPAKGQREGNSRSTLKSREASE